MWLPAIVSAVHLLCLALGTAVLLLRARSLAGPLVVEADFKRVLALDNASGLIALVWMGSGFYRAFGPLEKGTAFYTSSPLFWVKLGLVGLAWCFEMPTMLTLLRWRKELATESLPDPKGVERLRRLHHFELLAMVGAVFAASLMARGIGRNATPGAPEVRTGAKIYVQHCAACHQPDGRGMNGKLAADFVGDKTRLAKPDTVLLNSIENGVPNTAMMAFSSQLNDAERQLVLAYIRETFGAR